MLLAFGLTVGLLVLEGVARVFITDFYVCDERVGWRLRANQSGFRIARSREFARRIRINPHGLRGEDRGIEKPAGTRRILVLGDSMAAALQVREEETFAVVAERLLNGGRAAGEPAYEIVNGGVDGYGTAQELLLFREELWRYQPDLVIVEVIYNDLIDNTYAMGARNHWLEFRCGRPYFLVSGDETIPRDEPDVARRDFGFIRFLHENVRLMSVFMPNVPTAPRGPTFTLAEIWSENPSRTLEEAWDLTTRLILELDREVRGRGARLVVLVAPSPYEIHEDWARADLAIEDQDSDRVAARLRSFLGERSVPFIDLFPAFRAEVAGGTELFFRKDGHWNERGHALAGEVIVSGLRREGLLGQERQAFAHEGRD